MRLGQLLYVLSLSVCHLLITFAKFGPRSGPTKCRASSGSKLTLWWYSWKNFSKKLILKKISNKKHAKLPSRQRVMSYDKSWIYVHDLMDCGLFIILFYFHDCYFSAWEHRGNVYWEAKESIHLNKLSKFHMVALTGLRLCCLHTTK